MNCLNPIFRKTLVAAALGCFILMSSGCRQNQSSQAGKQADNQQDTHPGSQFLCQKEDEGKSEQLAPFAKDILNDDEEEGTGTASSADAVQNTDPSLVEDPPSALQAGPPVQNTHFLSCKCNQSGQPFHTSTDVQGAGPHHLAAHKNAKAACQDIKNTQAVYVISCKPAETYKVACTCRASGAEDTPVEGTGLNRLSAAQNAQARCKAARQTNHVFLLKCKYQKQAPKQPGQTPSE